MKEIERQENVLIGHNDVCFDYPCKGCGKNIRLWFNGGELDERQCCGYTYRLEHKRIDFVVEKD